MDNKICRCRWCNPKNPVYVEYHDNEWGAPTYDDKRLFELFLLEPFQAGLSWEIILNKRENFRAAFDGFDVDKIVNYTDKTTEALAADAGIIRNRRKISAAVKNAAVFKQIQKEYGSFSKYIWSFTDGEVVYEWDKTTSPLSDKISADLIRHGCSFMGSTVVYSLLQAAGVIYSHAPECYLFKTV